jgi:hypothetical protein
MSVFKWVCEIFESCRFVYATAISMKGCGANCLLFGRTTEADIPHLAAKRVECNGLGTDGQLPMSNNHDFEGDIGAH